MVWCNDWPLATSLSITNALAEEGIPLLRVANTGISAAFDGFGRKLGIPLGERAYLDIAILY